MKKNILIRKQPYNDVFFIAFMAWLWSQNILLRYIRVIIMRLPFIWSHTDLIIQFAGIVLFLLALPTIVERLYVREVFLLFLFYALFYLHALLYPANRPLYTQYAGEVSLTVFPMFLLGLSAYREKDPRFLELLFKLSVITVYAFAFYTLLIRDYDDFTLRAGDMNSAYLLLPHVCMAFGCMLRKPNVFCGAAVLIGSVMLLFLGTRGAVLCLLVCMVLQTLLLGKLKHPVIFLLSGIAVVLILFQFGLLDFLQSFGSEHGLSLRIFNKMEGGELLSGSGRDIIQAWVLQYIKKYPLTGMGIFSEYRVAAGHYAHNLILEIFLEYGVLIGTIFLLLLLFLFLSSFRYLRKKNVNDLILFSGLFCAAVVKLMISSAYLREPYFFFLIGYCVAAMEEKNNCQSQEGYSVRRNRG